jgi:PAS domain S-box-containing protein
MIKKVLIVDDSSDNLYILEMLLKGYGVEVISAENGKDALDKALLDPPDLIVTDILMPVMDGYALCRQWKSDDKLKHIPLVFYTATYTDRKDEKFALSLGADRFILKPQEPDIFMNILKEVLGEKYEAKQVVNKPLGEEMEFFKQYNEILYNKLEKKVTDLEIANQNLKILEDKYRSLFEHLQDAIFLTKPDGSILDANKAACVMFGRSVDEIRAVGRNGLVDVSDPRLQTALEERAQAGGASAEITMVRANGEKFPVDITSTIFTDMNGQQKTSMIIRDVTERKRAEDTLRKSEARFRSYFELPLIGIAITSPQKGWIEVNNRLSDILGYSVQELKGMSWSELTYPDDLPADVEQFNRVLAGEIESYMIDKRFIRKDGEVVWISLAVGCVRKQDGAVDYIVALLEDITDRKQAEEALEESEEKYRTLFENAGEAIFVAQDGKLAFLNPMTVTITGYSGEEISSRPFVDFIHENDRDMVLDRYVRRLKGENIPRRYSFRVIHKKGSFDFLVQEKQDNIQ